MNELLLLITDLEIFGADLIDKKDFFELLVKAIFNFLVIGYIVRYLYYPATKNKDYLFTYLLISVTVFCLCFLLENVKLELGFALGLFAIFGIIRYREGDKYIGNIKDAKREGYGIYHKPEGISKVGIWKSDEPKQVEKWINGKKTA